MKETSTIQENPQVHISIERIQPCRRSSEFVYGFLHYISGNTYVVYADAKKRLSVAFDYADYLVDLYIDDICQDTFYLSELSYRSLMKQETVEQADYTES